MCASLLLEIAPLTVPGHVCTAKGGGHQPTRMCLKTVAASAECRPAWLDRRLGRVVGGIGALVRVQVLRLDGNGARMQRVRYDRWGSAAARHVLVLKSLQGQQNYR